MGYRHDMQGVARWSVVGLLVFLASGCAGASTVTASDATSGRASTTAVAKSPTTPATNKVSPPTTAAPKAALESSTIQNQTRGGITVAASGAILPNSARTPGAVNPEVTQANIAATICVSGWTATVRPDSSVTTELKKEQLASGYAYKGDTATGDYEEDHLISLEIGGAPNAEANLWPEPYNAPDGARVKDVVENKLHSLVCDHTITLATAQKAIATNWWVAYQTRPSTAGTCSSICPSACTRRRCHGTVQRRQLLVRGPSPGSLLTPWRRQGVLQVGVSR
jgi:hypothetical protein